LNVKSAMVTLVPREGRALFLGCGPLPEAEILAKRLSELTGAPIARSGPPAT
jgi:hypothetical protein